MTTDAQAELIATAQQWRGKPLGREFEAALAPLIDRCAANDAEREQAQKLVIAIAALGRAS